MRISGDLQRIGFNKQYLLLNRLLPKPPWTFSHPVVNIHLLNYSKHNTSPDVLQSHFAEIRESYRNSVELYTDT